MRFLFLYLLLLYLSFGAFAQCVNSTQIDSTVMCPMVYDPVCGCNGITYGNSCEAYYLGGVTAWVPGICGGGSACINPSQIDSSILCPTVLDPVCGCDSVTYSNSCVAQYYSGVTSWTPGPCQTQIQLADSCADLTGINFGVCAQFLGYGLVNGVCTPISGCGTIAGNVDYAPALSPSMESCQNGCMDISYAPACSNLANVDFGACAMPLGYGIVGSQCQLISGCSTISGTTDYSSSLYSIADSCQLCLSGGLNGLLDGLKLYPTITDSYLFLEVPETFLSKEYLIMDCGGKVILTDKIREKQTKISVEHVPPGVYIFNLVGEYKQHFRLIKN
jgi:hypothetical protein